MDGILLVQKPQGFSSHDVVNVLRGILHTKKIGHTGTLDPDATGLLVIGVNNGTKIMQFLNQDEKTYEATVCIGKSTNTQDKTGEVVLEQPVQKIEDIDSILTSFKGIYTQTPPMYSAIKYNGKRLYEYARKGITITDIPSRDITIYDIKRTSDITYRDNCAYVSYVVHGSKGLYVRTLSYDIGRKLGYPAYNDALHRTKAGRFDIKDAYTLEDVKEGNYQFISLSDALAHLPYITMTPEIEHHIKNGMALSTKHFEKPTLSRIIDTNNNLVAIYDLHPTDHKMKAVNIFYKG